MRAKHDWRVVRLYFWLLTTLIKRMLTHMSTEGECVVWSGSARKETALHRIPHARLMTLRDHLGDKFVENKVPQQVVVRELMVELFTRKIRPANCIRYSVIPECGCPICINPEHAKYMTFGQASKRAYERSPEGTRLMRAMRISKAREKYRKLSDEDVIYIRTNQDKNGAQLARELGVCKEMVNGIRSGRFRKQYIATPFSGLMTRQPAH